jgi:hypothetical protein
MNISRALDIWHALSYTKAFNSMHRKLHFSMSHSHAAQHATDAIDFIVGSEESTILCNLRL